MSMFNIQKKPLGRWGAFICKIAITGLTLYPTQELTRYILDYWKAYGDIGTQGFCYSFSFELAMCMWLPFIAAMIIMWIWL